MSPPGPAVVVSWRKDVFFAAIVVKIALQRRRPRLTVCALRGTPAVRASLP